MRNPWKRQRIGWAGQWDRHVWPIARTRRRRNGREVRLMVEAGLLIGLAVFNLMQFANAHVPTPVAETVQAFPRAVNPWAESERSRGILAGQEGAPSAIAAAGGTSTVARPAAVRVIDGDTFDYAGERIRISDIDTPEVRGQCADERERAAQATQRLSALLAAGPFELVRNGRDEDRYGRKLRVVTRDGRSIGDMLVAEGLARTWTGRREPWC